MRYFLAINKTEILTSLVLSFSIFFFPTLSIYQNNSKTLNTNYGNIFLIFLTMTLISGLFFLGISMLTRKIVSLVSVIYIFFSFFFWIQGNFINYKIGPLDGHQINWANYYTAIWVEIIVWGLLLVISLLKRNIIYKNLEFLLGLLILLQLGSIISPTIKNLSSNQTTLNNTDLMVDNSNEFNFSKNKNVLIIVLDTFRSDIFEDITNSNPILQKKYKDFIFYQNTISEFPNTYASIPSILTGTSYTNQITTQEYLKKEFKNSLPTLLKQNNFTVQIFPLNSDVLSSYPNVWDNVSNKISLSMLIQSVKKIYVLSLIRYSPMFAKPFFVNLFYAEHGISSNNDILELYNNSITTNKKEPVFKFIHLSGVHPNFTVNEKMSVGNFDFTFENYYNQAQANLIAVAQLLDNMKEEEVYDNTLIIILGDHGIQSFTEEYSSFALDIEDRTYFLHDYLPHVGYPLLLIKDFYHNQSQITNSNVPLTLSDIPKIVADSLNIESNYYGYNPLIEYIPEDRLRKFYFYDSSSHKWGENFMPPLFEYQISGPAKNVTSWSFSGKIFEPREIKNFLISPYAYGENLVQSLLSTQYEPFLSTGFDYSEVTWARAPMSCIYVPVLPTQKHLQISIEAQPFLVPGILEEQRMFVFIDGNKVFSTNNGGRNTFIIPVDVARKYTDDQLMHFCFLFPDKHESPKTYQLGDDYRELGYSFSSIIINEAILIDLPKQFMLNSRTNPNDLNILKSGWSQPEPDFIWTDGNSVSLSMVINNFQKDTTLLISAFPYLGNNHIEVQNVTILSNGQQIGNWKISKEGQYSIRVPADTIKNGILEIELILPDATSPKELSLGEDSRLLGIAVNQIQIIPSK